MRMNYVPDPQKIEAGLQILAEEIERAWGESARVTPAHKA